MGRPSKLTDKQWESIVAKFDLDGLVAEASVMENNERAITLMLKLSLACGDLAYMLGLPAISGHRFEFSVKGGRIDLLLFHTDGSASIVEAKAEDRPVVIAAGIGQLCMYAAALPAKLHAVQQPALIRRVLCAHLPPEKCGGLIAACEMAGVKFAYLPSVKYFKSMIDAMLSGSASA